MNWAQTATQQMTRSSSAIFVVPRHELLLSGFSIKMHFSLYNNAWVISPEDNNLQNLKNISMLRTCWRIQMVSQEKANTSCPRGENTEQSRRNVWAVLHTENLHHTVLCLTKTHCFICKEVSVTCRQKAWIIMKNSESETSDSQMYWRQIKSDIILIGAKKLVTELTQVIR